MFTLKFYNVEEDTWNVFSCPHYELCYKKGEWPVRGVLVIIYKELNSESGIEYQVGIDDKGYDTLFIENNAGKTIDRIGPFEKQNEDHLKNKAKVVLKNNGDVDFIPGG